MATFLSSLSRIWVRDETQADSSDVSQFETPSESLNNICKSGSGRPITSPYETLEFASHRRHSSSRTILNPASSSVSSPSCVIAGCPRSALSGKLTGGQKLEFPFVGHSRSQHYKLKPKHIMWEDSGYESPSQKKGSHASLTPEKDRSEQDEPGIPNKCYDDKGLLGDINANTSEIRNNFEDNSFGEKFPALLRSQSNYIPPSILNYRYQPRRSKSKQTQGFDLDKSLDDINLTGMSPTYTSTPIKSTTKEFDGLRLSSDGTSSSLPPAEIFSFSSPSSQQLACTEGTNLSLSTSSLTKEMVDEGVLKIVEEGSEEFRTKYSQWIAQVFHIQLDKMQRRLKTEFAKNLETVIREKEREIITLQQKYRNKLIEFEASTEKFQKWIETLADENHKVRETKDAIISEMQRTAADQKENFRIDLEKQINNVQAECEKEKLTMQRKHADQLKTINEKSMGQVNRLEEQFGKQVDSLQALIGELKSQNVTMESELQYFKKSSDDQHSILHNKYINYHKEREQMLVLINDLREKLSLSEKEKAAIVASHNEEIFNIQKETERINQNVTTRMASSQSVVEGLHRRHDDEIAHMKKQMKLQESQYKQAIDDLRNTYGHRITQLTKTVEGLQNELLGGRVKTSNLV